MNFLQGLFHEHPIVGPLLLAFQLWMLIDAYRRQVEYFWYLVIFFMPEPLAQDKVRRVVVMDAALNNPMVQADNRSPAGMSVKFHSTSCDGENGT